MEITACGYYSKACYEAYIYIRSNTTVVVCSFSVATLLNQTARCCSDEIYPPNYSFGSCLSFLLKRRRGLRRRK